MRARADAILLSTATAFAISALLRSSACSAFSPSLDTPTSLLPSLRIARARAQIWKRSDTETAATSTTALWVVPPSARDAAVRLATLAGETAVRWIIPAIAVRILVGGFGSLFGGSTRKGGSDDNEDSALAALLGDDRELDSSFYNEEVLEDIALGTNLGPWSPNGYIKRQYSDSFGGRDGFDERPIQVVWNWFWGREWTSDDGPGSSPWSRDRWIYGRRNPGLPRLEYLRVDRLNERLESYKFSVRSAVRSRAVAATDLKAKNFFRAYGLAVGATAMDQLGNEEMSGLLRAEAVFLKKSAATLGKVHACDRELRDLAIKKTLEKMDNVDNRINSRKLGIAEGVVESSKNATESGEEIGTETEDEIADEDIIIDGKKNSEMSRLFAAIRTLGEDEAKERSLMMVLARYNGDLVKHELDFISNVVEILGLERAPSIRAAMLHTSGPAGRLVSYIQNRPLQKVLDELGYTDPSIRRKSVYVCDFPGDISASQVKMLREEITGIIRSASPGDEAVVVLKSGGGSVTGYGLAAGQLQRLKDAGLRLTICVEELAASGGYMMCCVADKIVASPFAVLGSIGVMAEVPNVFERLKREGVEFQTVTAGTYKRVLSATKKVTKEDLDKAKDEVEEIFFLFKNYVSENRPTLDLELVATGETWFGEDALKMGLCDAIATKDDVLLEYVNKSYDVFSVRYEEPKDEKGGLRDLLPVGAQVWRRQGSATKGGILRRLVREIVAVVRDESSGLNLKDRAGYETTNYMFGDARDTAIN